MMTVATIYEVREIHGEGTVESVTVFDHRTDGTQSTSMAAFEDRRAARTT